MEPRPRGRGRSPVSAAVTAVSDSAVSAAATARVAQKLDGHDTLICMPYRPRKNAALADHLARKTAAAALDVAGPISHSDHVVELRVDYAPAPPDALSLSGSTPPSSPTMHSFTVPKVIVPDALAAGRPRLALIDVRGADESPSTDAPTQDASFRKHNRGIGSIDSILSSTTCVNTQSECSRPESRLSKGVRPDVEDAGEEYLVRKETGRYISRWDASVPASTASSSAPTTGRPVVLSPDDLKLGSGTVRMDMGDQGSDDEESRLIDEISSLVLRNTCGKEVDECAAPLLVSDCTYRYIQELSTAAHEGRLGFVQAASGQTTPSSHSGGSPGFGDNDQGQYPGGKGKRKAEGGSDDGSGMGGGGNGQGDDDGDMPMMTQGYQGRQSRSPNLSCPYRKRNPLRFNVRDHYVCATHSFADMSQLKKHIRAHHPPVQRNAGPFLCPRCCQGFPSKNELDCHLRAPDVCRVSYDSGGADPEDGITQKIISSLEARSLKAKIDNWKSLWNLLFPEDSIVPESTFVPVMEVFDFIAESKKFLNTLKDLLEIQYQHVLDGSTQAGDVELKIRQGLERSTLSIYNWIETVVQDWETRISGTVSFFTSSGGAGRDVGATNSWSSTPQLLPPSPASTPTILPGTTGAVQGGDSPNSNIPIAPRGSSVGASARRRPNPPPKRVKRAELTPKPAPSTQIPVPIQRARTPQGQPIAPNSFRQARPVLPSQSITIPDQAGPPSHDPRQSFQASWDSPTVNSPYGLPYSTNPGMFPSSVATQYATIPSAQPQLDVQLSQAYLPSEPSPNSAQPDPETPLHHDPLDPRHSGFRTSRLLSSSTPRSSFASSWIRTDRDENRDSSQTLVEAHPPGRCHNIYCPSCSKALADEVAVVCTQAPAHTGVHVSGVFVQAPITSPGHAPGPGTGGAPFGVTGMAHFAEGVPAWDFHQAGAQPGHHGGDGLFGGQGMQEGY